jgi:acetyl esterase/lipase
MSPESRAKLQSFGRDITPAMIEGTKALMTFHAAARDPAVQITRDKRYGPDERNRLDVFVKGKSQRAPVLVFVHGGGYVMGDKTSPGSPFYDNIGQWAARQGWIGVTMTYRLAPQNRWPSGVQDMAHLVGWLRTHIAEHGGDPDSIFLMGQSAGAAHVAAYVSHPQFHPGGSSGIAGALMVSGIYDPTTQPPNPSRTAYYGEEPQLHKEASCIAGLLASEVALLFSVSELDPDDFQNQAAQVTRAWHQNKGRYPPMEYLAGHNHLTPAQAIGSIEDDLGPRVAAFIATYRPVTGG